MQTFLTYALNIHTFLLSLQQIFVNYGKEYN